MPSIKWCVEPVFLSKKAIPPDKTRINELECNANNTLVGLLRQLSSLVQISDRLFADLNDECRQLCERTICLKFKLNRCQAHINQTNPKGVRVPVGNLNQFIQIERHFKSNQEFNQCLFKLDTRPQCIRDAYLSAALTPLHIIRSIDSYRDDGRSGSKLFICQPVFADSRRKVNFDIETRRPASLVLGHELPRNVLIERAKTPLCESHNVILNKEQRKRLSSSDNTYENISLSAANADQLLDNDGFNGSNDSDSQQNPLYGLISPEERMQVISGEFPSKYIPIDVTGIGFNRMSNLRRSLIHTDFMIKRKKSTASHKGRHNSSRVKRRNTISEVSPKGTRGRIRRRSAGSIDFVHTSCQTEPNETAIYTSGRVVDVKKCRSNALIGDYNNNNNNDQNCDNYNTSRETTIKLKADVHHHYETRSLDNLIDVSVSNQRRHQSVGSDMPELSDSNEGTEKGMEDNSEEQNKEVSVKCKTNSNSLTTIKMRDSKGVGSDGRSSSGNWSASSSTHASESIDSDHQLLTNDNALKNTLPHTMSDSSIGKDSVISDTNTTQTHTESEDRASAVESIRGNNHKVVIRPNSTGIASKVQFANRDSESWLQYYDSSDTITPTPPESERSGQTTRPNTTTSCSGSSRRSSFSVGKQPMAADDEVESVYSVDNDGYYTSMHTDSGLFRLPVKLMITPNSSFRCKGKRDSIASNVTVGDISINSILSKTETESSTTTLTNLSSLSSSGRPKLPPPPPPPRVSSMLNTIRHSIISNRTTYSISEGTTTASNGSTSSRSHSPSPATITSESEHSDFAGQQTLKAKTCIDSSRYPSMCAAITSTENSDDCRSNSSDSGSNRMTPTRRMLRSKSGAYRGFRIKDIFGFGHSFKEERSSPITVPSVPHIATIRRPQSPMRFNMYTGEGGHRVRRFIDKFNANVQTNTYQTPNIVRTNAITSFARDFNESSNTDSNSSSNAIKTAKSDMTSDVVDSNQNTSNTSKSVPNSKRVLSAKVTHNGVNAIPRQVSIPVPKALDYKPSKSQTTVAKTTTLSTLLAKNSRPTTPSNTSAYRNSRTGARVTLDADGEVIYASNSLGRRRDGHPMNYLNQIQKTAIRAQDEERCATLPKAHKARQSSSPQTPANKSGAVVHIQPNGNIERINGHKSGGKHVSDQTKQLSSIMESSGNDERNGVSGNSHVNATPIGAAPVSRCITPVAMSRRSTTPSKMAFNGTVDKNVKECATHREVKPSMTTKTIESELSDFVPNSTSSPLSSQPNSQKSMGSASPAPADSNASTLQRRGRLTTEDLLIIIHNSKKKHNIKTEPQIIIANSPPSSRSHSSSSSSTHSPPSAPVYNGQHVAQQTPTRPITPSRTPQPLPSTIDRRSWNGTETPSPNVCQAGNRRSLASDRLGPPKPTTMNDFKRLLSQTRSNIFNNDRLSAAEILRANAKRPLTPVIKCITSFVGNGTKTHTSKVTPSPAPTPSSMTPNKPSRVTPSPSPSLGPPPQIMNGAISANTPNLIKPRIINGRSIRHTPSHRMENICQPILEDSSEDLTDDKKCANIMNGRHLAINGRYCPQKYINTPIINNYNKVSANPQSTSTWV